MALSLTPTSPVIGMVNSPGDASHPAFVQLQNPSGSGKTMIVYQLLLGASGSLTNRAKMRRTSSPLTMAGTTVTGLAIRSDERDTTGIVGVIQGCNQIASTFAESASFWYDKLATDGSSGYQETPIITPGTFPLTIKAGSAIEFLAGDNGATIALRLFAIWDEV